MILNQSLKKLRKSALAAGIFLVNTAFGMGSPLKTVESFDLKRYMGDWHVIAYIPNWIEKDCVSSVESYALRADGQIDNWFVCHKSDGSEVRLNALAWIKDDKNMGEWKIRFNWNTCVGSLPVPLSFAYALIDLDLESYQWAVVGHPNRNLLWIMAREPHLDDPTYETLLGRAAHQGFDVHKLVRIPGIQK